MAQDNTQQPIYTNPDQGIVRPDMTPDQAAAALAFATTLSEGMIPRGISTEENSPETPENAPGEEKKQETTQDTSGMKDLERRITSLEEGRGESDNLEQKLKDVIRAEISKVRDEIKQALEDEQEE